LLREPHPRPTPIPYTTLFRSIGDPQGKFLQFLALAGGVEKTELRAEGGIGEAGSGEGVNGGIPASLQRLDIRRMIVARDRSARVDRKSTRLNSSHVKISYAVV